MLSKFSYKIQKPMRIACRASDWLTLIPQLFAWLYTHQRLYRHEQTICCPTFAQNPLVNEYRWEKMMEHTTRQTERAIGVTGYSVAHSWPDSICTGFDHLWFIHFNDDAINDFCVKLTDRWTATNKRRICNNIIANICLLFQDSCNFSLERRALETYQQSTRADETNN